MLFQITEFYSGFWDIISEDGWGDPYKSAEQAGNAIIESIKHGREWQEILEHLAVKRSNGSYLPIDENNKWKRISRANSGKRYLKEHLFDDDEDWKRVKKHINKLPNLDRAWRWK